MVVVDDVALHERDDDEAAAIRKGAHLERHPRQGGQAAYRGHGGQQGEQTGG